MKYTKEYLKENMINEQANPIDLGKRLAKFFAVGLPAAAVAGTVTQPFQTIATMAQDIGLGNRQKSWTLQGAKAGFGQGASRGQDTVSKAIIGNLPIQSELLRTVAFGAAGRPTWARGRGR